MNKPYSKEEYEKKLEEMQLDTFSGVEDARKMADSFFLRFPNKFTHTRYNVNSTGEYVFYSKNAKNIYQARFVEDSKFCQLITLKPMKDSYDYTEWGQNAQRIYEAITVGESADMVKFSSGCWMHVLGVEYSMLLDQQICSGVLAFGIKIFVF